MPPTGSDESLDDKITFRCSSAAKAEFEANVASRRWREGDVLRELLHEVNRLFRDNPKPERPFSLLAAGVQSAQTSLREMVREAVVEALKESGRDPSSGRPVREIVPRPSSSSDEAAARSGGRKESKSVSAERVTKGRS